MATQAFSDDINRRRAERNTVALATVLTPRDGEPLRAELYNMSRTGFMVETSHRLRERTTLMIEVPLIGKMHARVIWTLGNRMGGQFAAPLDETLYARFVDLFGCDPRS